MTPPVVKPGETSGLKGRAPPTMTKKQDAIGRKRRAGLAPTLSCFWSPSGVFPPTVTSILPASVGGIFSFDWPEPVCSLLFFLPPWSCVTAGSGLWIEVNVFVLTRHF